MVSITKEASASLESLSSVSSTATTVQASASSFTPKITLHIHSKGMRLVRFPAPSSELSIPIYNTDGDLKYISRRAKRCKGDAMLLRVKDQDKKPYCKEMDSSFSDEDIQGVHIISTNYFFGLNHDPVIEIVNPSVSSHDSLQESEKDINIEKFRLAETSTNTIIAPTTSETSATSFTFSSSWTSRTCSFILDNKTFSWEHGRTKLPSGEKARLLVLYQHVLPSTDVSLAAGDVHVAGKTSHKNDAEKVKVAQLIRSDSTRTTGTRASHAGNGGVLEMGALVGEGGEGEIAGKMVKEEHVIDEAIVVATCLSMLKKEMDRRRMLQTAVIMSAAGA